MQTDKNQEVFERIASALERISPSLVKNVDLDSAEGFVFQSNSDKDASLRRFMSHASNVDFKNRPITLKCDLDFNFGTLVCNKNH